MTRRKDIRIHPDAEVADSATIGSGTAIWKNVQIREDVRIGADCIISKDAYIDAGVIIGDRVKIQNGVSVYRGVVIEDGVFCGPHCTFTNDRHPRSITPDGSLKGTGDWQVTPTLVQFGASIGARATIVCGTIIGRWAMIAAGSVVTRNVPDHALVMGVPARISGYVCSCGSTLKDTTTGSDEISGFCLTCLKQVTFTTKADCN